MPVLPPIYPCYARTLVLRSAVLWVLVCLAGAVLAFVTDLDAGVVALQAASVAAPPVPGPAPGSVILSLLAVLTVPLIVTGLVLMDARTYRELVFHANLGTPPALVAGIAFATAFALQGIALVAWLVIALPR